MRHRLAGRWLTIVPSKLARALRHLEPMVEERRQLLAEHGKDYPDKPNDLLSWVFETERGSSASSSDIVHRILVLNFAAVHTTANVRSRVAHTCYVALMTFLSLDLCLRPLCSCRTPTVYRTSSRGN